MSSPKAKAAQIVRNMYKHQWRDDSPEWRRAKECALILVNEVIKVVEYFDDHSDSTANGLTYWKFVKKEIKVLEQKEEM